MVEVRREIKGKKFSLKVEEVYRDLAGSLLDLLDEIDEKKLVNNKKIQVGWSIYTLIENEDTICLTAPDYEKNPFEDITEDMTYSLVILDIQTQTLKKCEVEGMLISFQDKIFISKGVLDKENIYLERTLEYGNGFSGWYIGELHGNEKELEIIYAYELLKLRPSLIQVLVLPLGYMAVFENNEVEAIINEENINILDI